MPSYLEARESIRVVPVLTPENERVWVIEVSAYNARIGLKPFMTQTGAKKAVFIGIRTVAVNQYVQFARPKKEQ